MIGSQYKSTDRVDYVNSIKVNKVFVRGERFQKIIPVCVKRVWLILRFDNSNMPFSYPLNGTMHVWNEGI